MSFSPLLKNIKIKKNTITKMVIKSQIKKSGFFLRCAYILLKTTNHNLHQIHQKIPSQDTDFRILTCTFCMTNPQNCTELCMETIMIAAKRHSNKILQRWLYIGSVVDSESLATY